MPARTLSILGCGWLGLPLGRHLAARGYGVLGSTTTEEKLPTIAEAGITPFLLRLDPTPTGRAASDFFRADVLVLNIPPGRRQPDADVRFLEQIRGLLTELRYSPITFVVFASSTSVYATMNTTVVEEDAGRPRPWGRIGRALLEAEEMLRAETSFDTTVLRLGGLYGHGRHPGRFLAGRTDLPDADAPINLVHRDDVVAVVTEIIERDVRGETFNVVSDEHPTRGEFYPEAARRLGLEPPTFAEDGEAAFKIVSNARLKARLGYTFLYPDPAGEAP